MAELENIYVLQNDGKTHVHYEIEPLVHEQIPSIKHISMVQSNMKDKFVLNYNEKAIKNEVIFADNDFVKIFSFSVLEGSLEDALSDPGSIILTKSESKKLFNDESPIGKSIALKGEIFYLGESEVEVRAVIEDLPDNSNLSFGSIASFQTAKKMMPFIDQCIWGCSNVQNYVRLEKGQDSKALAWQMSEQLRPLIPEKINSVFHFMPYGDVYFSSIRDDFRHGNRKLLYTLSSIAILILLIATINYTNLSLSGSSKRLTEVGVKKIVGVNARQLVYQFLRESVLITFVALIIALLMATLITPIINNLSIINLPAIPLQSFLYWCVYLGSAIAIGVLAGTLPALSFNKFRPISLITGRAENRGKGINLKRGLIVFQFSISIILIVCTLTVVRQLSLIRSTDMGFEKENIIHVSLSPEVKKDVFKDHLQKIPGVEAISFSRWYPGNIGENWGSTIVYQGEEQKVFYATENADANYIDLMGLEMVQGRKFSPEIASDLGSVIINEAAAKAFGLENPTQAIIKSRRSEHQIIGVVKDFNFQSLHSEIGPLAIYCENEQVFGVNIKLSSGNFSTVSQTIDAVKKSWGTASPNFPFEFTFIDQQIESLYRTEIIFEKIFRAGSSFAIFISCLGLLGLVIGSTEQRRKEIGIRKVNGANIGEILYMLNRDFIKWVAIAFVLACPVAWYLMNKWLENFAYKTGLSWWIFALAGLLALGIALLTVSWQSWRAAKRNPVEALQYE